MSCILFLRYVEPEDSPEQWRLNWRKTRYSVWGHKHLMIRNGPWQDSRNIHKSGVFGFSIHIRRDRTRRISLTLSFQRLPVCWFFTPSTKIRSVRITSTLREQVISHLWYRNMTKIWHLTKLGVWHPIIGDFCRVWMHFVHQISVDKVINK